MDERSPGVELFGFLPREKASSFDWAKFLKEGIQ
jgi:hypothetical protein